MIDNDSDSNELPPMRWSWWDVAGLAIYTTGLMLNELDNGLRMLAGRCGSAATYSRQRRDERDREWAQERERQIMAKALEGGTLTFDPKDMT